MIDELINKLCPAGVECKELGEVAKILNGYSFKSGKYVKEGIRVIRISDVQKGKMSDKDLKFYPSEMMNEIRNYLLNEGDLVMSLTGNAGRVAMLSNEHLPAGLNQRVACIRSKTSKVLTRFLFYLFDQDKFEIEAMTNATGGGQKNLSTTWLSKYAIPIPPLEVQEEIVKTLDLLTTLEAELEAELEARKTQYTYYRDSLLSFEGKEVEWKTLGEISRNVSSGGTPLANKKEYYSNGTIPWLRTQEVRFNEIHDTEIKITELAVKESSAKWIPANCVIIAISGATAARSAINKIPLTTNQHCCCLDIDESLANYRYVFHWVSCKYEQLKSLGQGARADLNGSRIKSFPIPIPPLPEQERIVSILDKFDALVNDISIGLPAEIEGRRKQYEYYRNRLLTFNCLNQDLAD